MAGCDSHGARSGSELRVKLKRLPVKSLKPHRLSVAIYGSHTPYRLARKDNAKRLSDFLRADLP